MSNNPYPGLRPFEKLERHIFFGRETHTDELIERLGMKAETDDKPPFDFLAMMGPSGCGKSSLIRAGLLAGLEAGQLSKAGPRWLIMEFRPGNRPFANLAEAMLKDEEFSNRYSLHFAQSEWDKAPAFLEAELKRGPHSLHKILQHTPLPPKTNLLLLIDQFEDIFYYPYPTEVGGQGEFVKLLLESCQYPTLYVVIVMRSESLGHCLRFAGLPEAINQGFYLIPRLNPEQLRRAIEIPAKVFHSQVDPVLVDHLLKEMDQQPDGLPVLQHALMRMWDLKHKQHGKIDSLGLTDLEAIGTLKQVLSKHADEAYNELNPDQQKIAEVLFRRLIIPEKQADTQPARRPVRLGEIAELTDSSWQQVATVVDVFRREGRGFLTPRMEELTRNSTVDISHESLIRLWDLVKKWAQQESADAEQYLFLIKKASDWCNAQKYKKDLFLLRELELDNAWRWYEETKPTADWAKRYGGDFLLAMSFLKASKLKHKEEQDRRERERRRNIQMAWGVALAAITGLAIVSLLAVWGFHERAIAQRERATAQSLEYERTIDLFESQLTHAALLSHDEDYAAASALLKKTEEWDSEIAPQRLSTRNLVAWHTQLMGHVTPPQEYPYAGAPLLAVAVNARVGLLAAAGEGGTLVLFDLESASLKQRLTGHDGRVQDVCMDPEGKWLASAGVDKQIIFWSLPDGTRLNKPWSASGSVTALAVSPDGQHLAVATEGDEIKIQEVVSGEVVQVLEGEKISIQMGGLAFNHSGGLLAGAVNNSNEGKRHTAQVWDTTSGKRLLTLDKHTNTVTAVRFSPDGKFLATAGDHKIYLWETDSGKSVREFDGHEDAVQDLLFTPDSAYLISGSEDRTLRVWDVQSGTLLRVLQEPEGGGIIGLAMASNLPYLFSAGNDGFVRRWQTGLPDQQHFDLPAEPGSVALAPDLDRVAVGFADGSLRLYRIPPAPPSAAVRTLEPLWVNKAHDEKRVLRLAFHPNGHMLASAGRDNAVKLWKTESGAQRNAFSHEAGVNGLAFSANGRLLASGGNDGKIGLLVVGRDEEKPRFISNADDYTISVAFDSYATQVLTTGEKTVRLWNIAETPPTLAQEYPPTKEFLIWAALSPDGRQIAAVGRDQIIHLYSTTAKNSESELFGHQSTIFKVMFSPDSRQLATVSADATVRFWDLYPPSQKEPGELFALCLPIDKEEYSRPALDFDFRCAAQRCRVAVPLANGKLIIYDMDGIYPE